MRLREALVGIGLALLPGGISIGLAAAQIFPTYTSPLVLVGGLVSVVALLSVFWGYWIGQKRPLEVSSMGDTYNNNGKNFGHMGPINIGRQLFEFNQEIANEILRVVPKGVPVNFEVIGSQRSDIIFTQISAFMKNNGYVIGEVVRIGVKSPPASAPLEFTGRTLIIDADR